ncbi:unnamed protein product [Brachionus calyciflorus]|uniref:2-oxoisovalerate dehydrogenase subunit alpha n=1 Tax=Brachionus calyciflorus TaxID=104777 RepID=A0A813YCR8_9BILA|nr:unnamed protein product [Brachionus calyciflorus]
MVPNQPVFIKMLYSKDVFIDPSHEPKFDNESLLKMYKNMHLLFTFDMIMYEAQRQGRISFYLQNHGETAAQIGSACKGKQMPVLSKKA